MKQSRKSFYFLSDSERFLSYLFILHRAASLFSLGLMGYTLKRDLTDCFRLIFLGDELLHELDDCHNISRLFSNAEISASRFLDVPTTLLGGCPDPGTLLYTSHSRVPSPNRIHSYINIYLCTDPATNATQCERPLRRGNIYRPPAVTVLVYYVDVRGHAFFPRISPVRPLARPFAQCAIRAPGLNDSSCLVIFAINRRS